MLQISYRLHPSVSQRPRGSLVKGIMGRVYLMIRLSRQRQHLAEMDNHLLRDIGLDRRDAEREASRPFWDAPPHWFSKD